MVESDWSKKISEMADLRVHASLIWNISVHTILNGVFLIEICTICGRYLLRALTLCCRKCMTVHCDGKVEV